MAEIANPYGALYPSPERSMYDVRPEGPDLTPNPALAMLQDAMARNRATQPVMATTQPATVPVLAGYQPVQSMVTPPTETVAPQESQSEQLIRSLIEQVQGMGEIPPATVTTTQHTAAARSPELEAAQQDLVRRLNELGTGTREAYGGAQTAYTDLIRNLTNLYQTQASRQPAAVGTAALQSGLTPLEAAGRAGETQLDVLQQYFPQLAALQAQQAQVPVQLQQALGDITGRYAQAQQAMMPYQQAIAGETTTQEQQIPVSPMEQMQFMAQLAGQLSQAEAANFQDQLAWAELGLREQQMITDSQMGWAQIQQQGQTLGLQERQMLINEQLQRDQMSLQQWVTQQEMAGADRRFVTEMASRRQAQIDEQVWRTAERMGTQEFQLGFERQQMEAAIQRDAERAQQDLAARLAMWEAKGEITDTEWMEWVAEQNRLLYGGEEEEAPAAAEGEAQAPVTAPDITGEMTMGGVPYAMRQGEVYRMPPPFVEPVGPIGAGVPSEFQNLTTVAPPAQASAVPAPVYPPVAPANWPYAAS